jgi:YHS domain-containing protein
VHAVDQGPVNTDKKGTAVKGYDPVAYFVRNSPVKGKAEISFTWGGATWRFANEEHRSLFQSDPERYAPQYGGYCAYAMASGELADIDPRAWKIVQDKLYLNINRRIQRRWEKDISGYIKQADRYWPGVLKRLKQKRIQGNHALGLTR